MKLCKRILSLCLAVIIAISAMLCTTANAADDGDDSLKKGTFRCDWFAESLVYPYEYSDQWFFNSSYEYNHDIATFALELSMASFKSFDEKDPDKNVEKIYRECGFQTSSYGYETEDNDTIGVSFGKKKIVIGNSEFYLIALAVRSGNYGFEWGGNMRIGMGDTHEGFEIGKDKVLEYFNDYLSKNKFDDRVKLLIPGYSRGASVANLVAASLDDGTYKNKLKGENHIKELKIKQADIFAYTFEAPQCTKADNVSSALYKNIYNIINPSDYVPKFVMSDWGYSLYGVNYYLPSAENVSDYDDYYKELCATFDDMMAVNGKKAKDVFYNAKETRSLNAMLDSVLVDMGKEVFVNQKYYNEHFQNGVMFFARNYITQELGVKDGLETVGVMFSSAILAFTPSNSSIIKKEGYRAYIAKKIYQSGAGKGLSQKDCEGLLELLSRILDYVRKHRHDVMAMAGQLKTMMYVHQPYVELTWMKSIKVHNMKNVNNRYQTAFSVSYDKLSIPYKAKARLIANYYGDKYKVKWESNDKSIAYVNKDGYVTATGKGTAKIKATLYDEKDKELISYTTSVNVHMNSMQLLAHTVKGWFKKK